MATEPENRASPFSPRAMLVAFVTLTALAAAVRVPGIFTDFWLDEIWTFQILDGIRSPLAVITEVNHSNNHHLISWVYLALGPDASWSLYRIPSLCFGLGSVVLVWILARRNGKSEAVLATLLAASSYPLIHFSTEARGYAAVVFFALLAFLAADGFLRDGRRRWVLLGWLATLLGFLSHLMFIHAFLGVGGWLAVRLWQAAERRVVALRRFAILYSLPALCTAAFYFGIYRRMEIGESPPRAVPEVLIRSASLWGGGPMSGPVAIGAAVASVLLFLTAIVWLLRARRSEWLLHLLVIFVSPTVILLITRPEALYVRYFLISFAFSDLALGAMLASWWRASHLSRAAVVLLLAAFLLGNARNTARFLEVGHGGYVKAIRAMNENTEGRVIRVASSDDFGTSKILKYFRRVLPEGERLRYVYEERVAERRPTWMIVHQYGEPSELPEVVRFSPGRPFDRFAVYPYCGISGRVWVLYRARD